MKINCEHWSECGVKIGGCCALGKFGGRPSEGTCHIACLQDGWTPPIVIPDPNAPALILPPPPSRGLGDTVARFIHWISFGRIKPCCGCRRRQRFLNRLFPYKQKPKET